MYISNETKNYFSGDVGIGTYTPSSKLDVYGDIEINEGDLLFGAYNGISMLDAETGSTYCLFIGGNSAPSTNRGTRNTMVGWNNFQNNVTGTYNTGLGYGTLVQCTSGSHNTALGVSGLGNLTTGNNNYAIGSWGLYQLTTGSANIAHGVNALRNAIGDSIGNIGIGTSIGYNSEDHWTSSYNTIVGNYAANRIQSDADENTIVGYQAGYYLTRGSNNVLIGSGAGKVNVGNGSDNIIIGTGSEPPTPSGSNELNIGDLIYGDLSSGQIGIGTDYPISALHVTYANITYWDPTNGNWGGTTEPPQALTITNATNAGYDPILIFRQTTSTGVQKTAGAIGLVGQSSWTDGNLSTQISNMYFILRDSSGDLQERMRIEDNGNVGIGITNPTSHLDVSEDIGIWNPNESKGYIQGMSTNSALWTYYTSAGGWKYPMQMADTKANLGALGFYDGWVGIGSLGFGKLEGSIGTDILEFSIDGTLAGDSDNAVPTEKAVKTYVDAQVGGASSNKIFEGNSGVTVNDASTGTINISADNCTIQEITSAGVVFSRQQVFVDSNLSTLMSGVSGADWDLGTNQIASLTLSGNGTLNNPTGKPSNAVGQYTLIVTNTGTWYLSYGSDYKWVDGVAPIISQPTGDHKVDILTFVCDGNYMYGTANQDFS